MDSEEVTTARRQEQVQVLQDWALKLWSRPSIFDLTRRLFSELCRRLGDGGMTVFVLISITVSLASALAFISYILVLSLSSFGREVLASIAHDAADAMWMHGAQVSSVCALSTQTASSQTSSNGRLSSRSAGSRHATSVRLARQARRNYRLLTNARSRTVFGC